MFFKFLKEQQISLTIPYRATRRQLLRGVLLLLRIILGMLFEVILDFLGRLFGAFQWRNAVPGHLLLLGSSWQVVVGIGVVDMAGV